MGGVWYQFWCQPEARPALALSAGSTLSREVTDEGQHPLSIGTWVTVTPSQTPQRKGAEEEIRAGASPVTSGSGCKWRTGQSHGCRNPSLLLPSNPPFLSQQVTLEGWTSGSSRLPLTGFVCHALEAALLPRPWPGKANTVGSPAPPSALRFSPPHRSLRRTGL